MLKISSLLLVKSIVSSLSSSSLRFLTILCVALATCTSGLSQDASATYPSGAAPSTRFKVASADRSSSEEVGDALMYHKRFQAAIETYKQAADSTNVSNKIGIAYQMMFNLTDAVRSYKRALEEDPLNGTAANNLGTAYEALKMPGDAERMYRKAIGIDPNNAMFRRNLGSCLIAQQNFEEGARNYQEALALDPRVFEHNVAAQSVRDATPKDRGAMNYFMARGCVRAGLSECAISYLSKSVSEGFVSLKRLRSDADFAALFDSPQFKGLADTAR